MNILRKLGSYNFTPHLLPSSAQASVQFAAVCRCVRTICDEIMKKRADYILQLVKDSQKDEETLQIPKNLEDHCKGPSEGASTEYEQLIMPIDLTQVHERPINSTNNLGDLEPTLIPNPQEANELTGSIYMNFEQTSRGLLHIPTFKQYTDLEPVQLTEYPQFNPQVVTKQPTTESDSQRVEISTTTPLFNIPVTKQFTDFEPEQLTKYPQFTVNFAGNYSAPSSVQRIEIDEKNNGPKSAGLPLRESPVLDLCIPSVTSGDFNEYPQPPSSIFEEPSSTDDYCGSDISWIPDTDEELMCSPNKKKKLTNFKVPDSDATSVSSTTEIVGDLNSSQAVSPSLLASTASDNLLPSLSEQVISSTVLENYDVNEEREKSTKEKKLTRWKKSDPLKWKKNINKSDMQNCRPYLNKSGKEMPAKQPQPTNCILHNCRYDCNNFTEENRKTICKSYWALKTFQEKKQFILKCVKLVEPKRKNTSVKTKHRNYSREYYFIKGNQEIRVCNAFFMTTLNISNGPINNALRHMNEFGLYDGIDNRGRRSPVNKSKPEDVQFVRDHIERFPKMESHYCRKSSKRFYLDQNLSISKMYELYQQKCQAENRTPLSMSKYREIFGTEYNYSFFVPKKDQCSTCIKYKRDKEKYEILYKEHQHRKEAAEEAKKVDKERSQNDESFISVTADLQSVLQIPSGDVGELYYVRKLSVYNFTIYEAKPPNKAFCFMWNEMNGKRGSSEIATCLKKWLDQLSPEIKEVSIFSDTCSGQNRNQFVAAFFLHYIQNSHLDVIEQKYLESGHTMMEVDSVHSAIEHERKRTSIFSMNDWKNVAKRARSQRHRKDAPPYEVCEIKYNEVMDTKILAEKSVVNKTVTQDGKKMQWLKVKCLRYEKINPGLIKFRNDHSGDYSILDTREKVTRKKKAATNMVISPNNIPKAYKAMLPITIGKKNDLIELCRKEIIPVEYHAWIQSLPVQSGLVDRVPEPDILEESDYED